MTPILAAFWHRTRREFVAMTADDISRKINEERNQVVHDLRNLILDGKVSADNLNHKGATIYELPPKMQALVRAQVLAGVIQ